MQEMFLTGFVYIFVKNVMYSKPAEYISCIV